MLEELKEQREVIAEALVVIEQILNRNGQKGVFWVTRAGVYSWRK